MAPVPKAWLGIRPRARSGTSGALPRPSSKSECKEEEESLERGGSRRHEASLENAPWRQSASGTTFVKREAATTEHIEAPIRDWPEWGRRQWSTQRGGDRGSDRRGRGSTASWGAAKPERRAKSEVSLPVEAKPERKGQRRASAWQGKRSWKSEGGEDVEAAMPHGGGVRRLVKEEGAYRERRPSAGGYCERRRRARRAPTPPEQKYIDEDDPAGEDDREGK